MHLQSREREKVILIGDTLIYYDTSPVSFAVESTRLMLSEVQESEKILLERRKLEYMAIRRIKNHYFPQQRILYLPNGKPILEGSSLTLGISHSQNHALFAYSEVLFGCDIEEKNERLFTIKDRFVHPFELSNFSLFSNLDQLCILWSCKEAIYKLIGMRGINWKEQCILFKEAFPQLTFRLLLENHETLIHCHVKEFNENTWMAFAVNSTHG
ncbi:MAG: 4'-phosphopantetheinyl transferase superfamily protein [Bacteroidetes bacterium]|nr:4'-phosphopantetheinyl transferase superfamily protein [Bacteroidota bacterium]